MTRIRTEVDLTRIVPNSSSITRDSNNRISSITMDFGFVTLSVDLTYDNGDFAGFSSWSVADV